MTHDEAEDVMNDLAKDREPIDCDEEYERRADRARRRRTPRATRYDDDIDWDQEGDDEEEDE